MRQLLVKKMHPDAKLPTRGTAGSAGLDLCACIAEPIIIPGRGHVKIPTGIAIALPSSDYVALLFGRSGLANKHGLGMLNSVGVIDSDYRGEMAVGIVNQFDEAYTIQPGERIAQLVILPVLMPEPVEVKELDETARGTGGFGSTGK